MRRLTALIFLGGVTNQSNPCAARGGFLFFVFASFAHNTAKIKILTRFTGKDLISLSG